MVFKSFLSFTTCLSIIVLTITEIGVTIKLLLWISFSLTLSIYCFMYLEALLLGTDTFIIYNLA